jgi:hypothetical protein
MLELNVARPDELPVFPDHVDPPDQYFGIARYLRLIDSHFVLWSTPARLMNPNLEQWTFLSAIRTCSFPEAEFSRPVGSCRSGNLLDLLDRLLEGEKS